MGVDTTHYIIHGIKFDNIEDVLPRVTDGAAQDAQEARYEPIMDGYHGKHVKGDLVMVGDWMGSHYLVVGTLVEKGEHGLPMTRMQSSRPWRDEELLEKIEEKYPEIVAAYDKCVFEDPDATVPKRKDKPTAQMGIWVFTNYS